MAEAKKTEWKRWHKITVGSLAGLLVLAVAIAVLGPQPEETSKAKADEATPAQVDSAFDRPTQGERLRLIEGLMKIDPRITYGNNGRYVDRTINICAEIQADDLSAAKLVDGTVQRFEGGTLPDFTDSQAKQVIALAKRTFCD